MKLKPQFIASFIFLLFSFPLLAQVNYSEPLFFESTANQAKIISTKLSYDLQSSSGVEAQIANVRFNPNSLRLRKINVKTDEYLLFVAPDFLIHDGVIEFIEKTGKSLLSVEVHEFMIKEWQKKKSDFLKDSSLSEAAKIAVEQSVFGVYLDPVSRGKNLRFNNPHRACWHSKKEKGYNRFCTSWYEWRENQTRFVSLQFPALKPRVIINSENSSLKDEIEISDKKEISFFSELESGITIEFVTRPPNWKLQEIVYDQEKNKLLITGHSDLPAETFTYWKEKTVPRYIRILGLENTIYDTRIFTTIEKSLGDTFIDIQGEDGGIFRLDLDIKEYAILTDRVWTDSRTIKGTYNSSPPIKIKSAKKPITSDSKDLDKIQTTKEQNAYKWFVSSPKKAEFNKDYFILEDENGKKHHVVYDLYRAYQNELSARLTGILGSLGSYTILGEMAYNVWFDSVFGWRNYHLAEQRWGLSLRGSQSLTKVTVDTLSENLTNISADLKYRFEPGLWARDESFGAILGFQRATYGTFDANMLGVGFFWARSMPKVFDDFFNKLKFFIIQSG